jgi:transcriptional regulator with XRE-family HTH domain
MKRVMLVDKRRAKKLKQSDVAKMLGVTTRQYQRLEAGKIDGKIKHWDMLEDLFDTPQRQLRERQKEPDGNPAESNL